MSDRDSATVLAERLRAAARARYGTERARSLHEMIDLAAAHLAAVEAYALPTDEVPAFLADPPESEPA